MKSATISFFCLIFFLQATAQENMSSKEQIFEKPRNTISNESPLVERIPLSYEPVQDRDIFWQRNIVRVIDARQKINQHFIHPNHMFMKALIEGSALQSIPLYKDDSFVEKLKVSELKSILSHVDTIEIFDPIDYTSTFQIVENELDLEQITRFRMKEIWYVDTKTSQMKVRILGIAPMKDVLDEMGNFMYEQPMFWMYYPHWRSHLSTEQVYTEGNDKALVTWDDALQMRKFSGYVYQSSDPKGRRLKDYLSGVDLLTESRRIDDEVFNYEQDLWSY